MQRFIISIILFSIIIPCSSVLFGQNIPRDTSFTVKGTFEKERKMFPHIQIAEVNSDSVTIHKDIVYKKLKNRRLHVDVFTPQKTVNNIAIVLIHGGGWRTGDKSHMHQMSIALANKGYTCFAVEHRLSLEAPYPAAVIDVQDLIVWIKNNASKYQINKQHIVCLGTSSGGQIAALVGALNKSIVGKKKYDARIAAVIDMDGLLSFTHPDAQESSMAAQWLGGDSVVAAHKWKEASALSNITPFSAPMLFITSGYKRFSAGKNEVIAQYRKWNIPTDELNFENSPHTFWYFHPWFIPTIDKIDSFISELVESRN